ncbi:MAG: glycoside hydrolase family 127 protein, partial [Bacteroidetes bacterium]|nr:glycoside hydrolase family 127 protein [Bacteroidota bacterium]
MERSKISYINSGKLITILFFLFACQSKESTPSLPGSAKPFSLPQVELLDGPFKHATELNIESLLQYDPDRLLARFRQEAGLEAKAESYGGWEGESLAGHSLGHHLSACAFMYQTTGQDTFKNRAEYIVAELAEIQKANGDGYLGAFTNGKKIFEEEIKNGEIRSQGFDLNGLWSPFYTHHKVLAGLRDAYRLLGIEQALEVEKGFADWIGTIVLDLDHESVQKMLHCEFGGVQETLADLYLDTQDEKYMKIARVFHHETIIDSLAMGKDILPNKHGNTQIPKLIASTRLYEISKDSQDLKPATFFYDRVVNHHSYVT